MEWLSIATIPFVPLILFAGCSFSSSSTGLDAADHAVTFPLEQRDSIFFDSNYPSDQYRVGMGYGDLTKGRMACERLSETAARADLAKQLRVWVHIMTKDRVRERLGAAVEQDVEVVRRETVDEVLYNAHIVSYAEDERSGLCRTVVVMPKLQKRFMK